METVDEKENYEDHVEMLQSTYTILTKCSYPFVKVMGFDIISRITTTYGVDKLINYPELFKILVNFFQSNECTKEYNNSLPPILINVAAEESGAKALLQFSESPRSNMVHFCVREITNKKSHKADFCAMILSNMSRCHSIVNQIVTVIEESGVTWKSLVVAFTTVEFNKNAESLDHLAAIFNNLSVSPHFRRWLMKKDTYPIRRLLPFTAYEASSVRREGIAGTIQNCCFETDNHMWLLSPEIDLLPHILLPLAGPEEFDEEDNEKLPLDLQFLPETKTREQKPNIRLTLLQILYQLCATKEGREFLREKNAYVILREYHKWETDGENLTTCEDVVNVLLRTEEEIGADNIKDINVPAAVTEKFEKLSVVEG